MVYLFGDKLTGRVAIRNPLCALVIETESGSQGALICFTSVSIVHETTPKVASILNAVG